jgi:general secretion pathway protein G
MRSKRKRHPITLLEIMIVILLIGVIGGVLSYNLKGTLDKGKKFRTEEGKKRLQEILEIEIAQESITLDKLFGKETIIYSNSKAIEDLVRASKFIPESNLKDFLVDGWKKPYIVSKVNGNIVVEEDM